MSHNIVFKLDEDVIFENTVKFMYTGLVKVDIVAISQISLFTF